MFEAREPRRGRENEVSVTSRVAIGQAAGEARLQRYGLGIAWKCTSTMYRSGGWRARDSDPGCETILCIKRLVYPPTVDRHATTYILRIPNVRQVLSLLSLPCSVSLCFCSFSRFLVSSFPPFLVFSFSRFLVSSFPRFLVSSFPRFSVSLFPCFLISLFPCFLVSSFPRFLVSSFPRFLVSSFPRFPFRIPFRFPFPFTYRILFHDPRFSTDPRSGSHSGFRSRLAFLAAAPPAASRFAPARRCFI